MAHELRHGHGRVLRDEAPAGLDLEPRELRDVLGDRVLNLNFGTPATIELAAWPAANAASEDSTESVWNPTIMTPICGSVAVY